MLINTITSYWKTHTNVLVNPILNELATNSWNIKRASNKFLRDRKENEINNKRVKWHTENGESTTCFLSDEFNQPCQIHLMTLILQGRELRQRGRNKITEPTSHFPSTNCINIFFVSTLLYPFTFVGTRWQAVFSYGKGLLKQHPPIYPIMHL